MAKSFQRCRQQRLVITPVCASSTMNLATSSVAGSCLTTSPSFSQAASNAVDMVVSGRKGCPEKIGVVGIAMAETGRSKNPNADPSQKHSPHSPHSPRQNPGDGEVGNVGKGGKDILQTTWFRSTPREPHLAGAGGAQRRPEGGSRCRCSHRSRR